MATTTNYGWTTPDDTALVKDGAAAIRTLGSSVDTTTKNLNPETTLADIAYRSSTSNVNTRLGIGSTGQVLTVAGGVPSWATPASGSMTLLSTTTLSGATVTISGINQTYKHLFLTMHSVTNATADGRMRIAPNGSTNICVCNYNDNTATFTGNNNTRIQVNYAAGATDRTSTENVFNLYIYDYANTTYYKGFKGTGALPVLSANYAIFSWGQIKTNSAITSLEFDNTGGSLTAGTVLLYGVN